MAPEPDHEEDYVSEEDTDFAPDDAPAEDSDLSASDDDDAAAPEPSESGKRKRDRSDGHVEDAGFENSGDEAIIEKGKKRQKKPRRKDGGAAEEDTGDGGVVKTRRMRAEEYATPAFHPPHMRLLTLSLTERPSDEQTQSAGRLPSTWTHYGHR